MRGFRISEGGSQSRAGTPPELRQAVAEATRHALAAYAPSSG